MDYMDIDRLLQRNGSLDGPELYGCGCDAAVHLLSRHGLVSIMGKRGRLLLLRAAQARSFGEAPTTH